MALQNKKHQVNELKSARLELELLKKHIQPHFLLNSLNSIIAWLEENPKTAAKLVHALAEELRLILDFSKEKLVNLSDELRLCQLHCEVMGLRQDKQYVLETGVVPQNHYVPPLIIHTLVENGLTHGYSGKIGGTFLFTATEDQDTISYTMYNDCVSPCKEIIKTDGTGLRYVKSRLQEAFPGRWNLTAGSKGTGFEICILIRKTK
jgi:LytS/YehU family sensor histidine kinase